MKMDVNVSRKAKYEGVKTGFRNFKRDIKTCIDKGIPLFWSVTLGIVKEPEIPQAKGGHMLNIIGYNDTEGKIIYSDSWGAGHEFKKMNYEDAWLISMSLISLDPRKK